MDIKTNKYCVVFYLIILQIQFLARESKLQLILPLLIQLVHHKTYCTFFRKRGSKSDYKVLTFDVYNRNFPSTTFFSFNREGCTYVSLYE